MSVTAAPQIINVNPCTGETSDACLELDTDAGAALAVAVAVAVTVTVDRTVMTGVGVDAALPSPEYTEAPHFHANISPTMHARRIPAGRTPHP
ncbi:hypothetical protein ABZU32_30935 [Sphaerisporangium sp. NPDC005288]|uniref:hypothetical protein n=1 Tax=Sphaerisporangium sp. NPDC005288 TaxID=3155114 RepID=UPI0033A56A07